VFMREAGCVPALVQLLARTGTQSRKVLYQWYPVAKSALTAAGCIAPLFAFLASTSNDVNHAMGALRNISVDASARALIVAAAAGGITPLQALSHSNGLR
jgi:hypothetical protein